MTNIVLEDYWTLVDADPREWDRNQTVLFWWIVLLLPKSREGGFIGQPDKAPLTDEQIIEVFKAVLPSEGETERSYLDHTWSYRNQRLVFPSIENHLVSVIDGAISVEKDPVSHKRREEYDFDGKGFIG